MAKAIMVQGTMSNAGKSLIAAGLCRVFHEDGWRVAPFKSQNMALNSFITDEGLEMGRAQVVQAEACGIRPSALMNPILLKPTTDMGSQVIVMGRPVGTMEAREYYRRKKEFIPMIRKAYEDLAAENDIIVIEGAGSPAEINLKQDDLVNMGMAKMADAEVLLVGDIDRGGVFAQLLGTIELLDPDEQDRIRGLIINKFRGDPTILEPGLRMLEERTGKPVIGVVPYADVHLEDEDSLAFELGKSGVTAPLDIAVVRLPRISNFTDFEIFSAEPAVSVRYVSRPQELGRPDLVIIPGTKSTIADLLWMRQNGLEAAILHLHANGTPVLGICGGFQMLGEEIRDPEGAEVTEQMVDTLTAENRGQDAHSVRGMGLLPTVTVFDPDKTQTQKSAVTPDLGIPGLEGKRVTGYEVHMGRTSAAGALPSGAKSRGFLRSGDRDIRWAAGGDVYGTYLHGLFDEADFRDAVIAELGRRKGLAETDLSGISADDYRETQMARLAEVLRKSLDMNAIYGMLSLEMP